MYKPQQRKSIGRRDVRRHIPYSDLAAGWKQSFEDCLDDPSCALLVVDLQKCDVDPTYLGNRAPKAYYDRMKKLVTPNVIWLQKQFRHRDSKRLIHLRVAPASADGSDMNPAIHCRPDGAIMPRNYAGWDFVEETAPAKDELVVEKHTCSAFMSTNLERQLRWMGIKKLLVVGVVTQNCVLSTVINAYELGFEVIVVQDAVASHSPKLHNCALEIMKARFAKLIQIRPVRDQLEGKNIVEPVEDKSEPEAFEDTISPPLAPEMKPGPHIEPVIKPAVIEEAIEKAMESVETLNGKGRKFKPTIKMGETR